MAKSYEELLSSAEKIMENELPESNTHVLVGTHMKDVVERMQDDDTQRGKKFTELEKKLKGDKEVVDDGFEYPFVQLGSFADYEGLRVALDGLHSRENTAQVVGEFRALMNGNLLFIRNYVRSWADEDFIQYIEGTVKLNDDGGLTVASYVSSFTRRYSDGSWSEWTEIGSGGGGGGTGDYVSRLVYENEQKDQDQKIEELEDAVFPLTIAVSGGGTFEKGTTRTITVGWSVKKGGETVTAESVTVNDEHAEGTSKAFEGVGATTTYTVKASYQGKTVQGSTTARFVAPMYFGFASWGSVADGLDIDSLRKQALKTSPGGTYTLENPTKGYYMWLCVPSSMSIGKVTSSGFDVPMLEAEEGSTDIDSYRCYRSASGIDAGSFTIVVS